MHWSKTDKVRWRVALPEPGNSTPVVWGNRVFVTQASPSGPRHEGQLAASKKRAS
jgi:hypothetical protein